jgi:hypothetical protein
MRWQWHPMLRRALLLFAFAFLTPSANAQIAQWQSVLPTTGRLGGEFLVTITGTNFATSTGNTYRCQFELSSRSLVVNSAPVSASSATRVVCTAPAFPVAANTVLKVITQTGATVTKSGAAAVFAFVLPAVTISGPSVFVMADCGTLQTLTLTVAMSHPTSNLGISSTLLLDRDTGAVVTSGRLASSSPSKQYSVAFTWTPASLSADKVSRALNFSVVVTELEFASPDRVEVWREVRCAADRAPHLLHNPDASQFSDRGAISSRIHRPIPRVKREATVTARCAVFALMLVSVHHSRCCRAGAEPDAGCCRPQSPGQPRHHTCRWQRPAELRHSRSRRARWHCFAIRGCRQARSPVYTAAILRWPGLCCVRQSFQ